MSNIVRRPQPLPPDSDPPAPEGERYTVLLLDEQQLGRLLNRSQLRNGGPGGLPVLAAGSARTSRRRGTWTWAAAAAAAGATAAMALLGVAYWWTRRPVQPPSMAVVTRSVPVTAPVVVDRSPAVATGASFSLQVASYSRDADARAAAARLTRMGLPAFAWRVDAAQRSLFVGPFVAVDEAEDVQRALMAKGFGRTRLHVDDRLRTTGPVPMQAAQSLTPDVLLVAAPGRLAVAFELALEPRRVTGQRVDATTFEIAASATGAGTDPQEWSAPADVQLVKHVSVTGDPTGTQGLRATVKVSENAAASVRLEGRRIYVDVLRTQLDFDEPGTGSAPANRVGPSGAGTIGGEGRSPAARPTAGVLAEARPTMPVIAGAAAAAVTDPAAGRYRAEVEPLIARFEEMQPFLRAAVAQGTPEVLGALVGSFNELEASLRAITPPPSAAGTHGLLASAIQMAKEAVGPGVGSDRMPHVREAVALFQAARAKLR